MRAIRKRPGEAPEIVDVENTLEALQAEVGGQIESLRFAADATILCNEEGKLMKLSPQYPLYGRCFVRHDFGGGCERRSVLQPEHAEYTNFT